VTNQGGTHQDQKSSGSKNGNDTRQSSAKDDTKQSGTHEQHVKGGKQSHKNDR